MLTCDWEHLKCFVLRRGPGGISGFAEVAVATTTTATTAPGGDRPLSLFVVCAKFELKAFKE